MTTTVDQLLHAADALLLDFDGPICTVFAGLPASTVARRLRTHLASLDWGHDDLSATAGPHSIWASTEGATDHIVQSTEATLTDSEVEAIATARPTPGAADLLRAFHVARRPVAIVSNNAAKAIERYLDLHNLRHLVAHIEGRDARGPQLMKPNPRSLKRALTAISVNPQNAIFVGDSISDADAARAAKVRFIGFAQRDDKRVLFARMGIAEIIPSWPHRSVAS